MRIFAAELGPVAEEARQFDEGDDGSAEGQADPTADFGCEKLGP